MSAYTIFLDQSWDLTLTGDGKIKVATGAYSIAQNASNRVRLFTNDAYFERKKGIPHFDIELGHSFTRLPILESRISKELLTVEGVTDCAVSLNVDKDRIAGGNAYITVQGGRNATITF